MYPVTFSATYEPERSRLTTFFRLLMIIPHYVLLMLYGLDAFPPFDGEPDPSYPAQVEIGPPQPSYSRVKAFFRLIVGIPVLVMAWLYGMLLAIVPVVSWLAIVFTGRQPEGLQDLTRGALLYHTRAQAYFLLLTEDYPPTSMQAAPALEQLPATGGLPS